MAIVDAERVAAFLGMLVEVGDDLACGGIDNAGGGEVGLPLEGGVASGDGVLAIYRGEELGVALPKFAVGGMRWRRL